VAEKLGCAGGSSGSLFAGCPSLLDRRLTIAFLQCWQHHGADEFFLAMVVKFDYDVIVGAREYRAETELSVLDLCSLSIWLFVGHGKNFLLDHCNN
jgi:hypothetical protein